MSDLYNLSLSNLKNIKPEMKEKIEVKKENIYASWPKEKNTWVNTNYQAMPTSPPPPLKPPLKPPLPPPPLPVKRQLTALPEINRTTKPKQFYFKEGYIEKEY